MTTAQETIPTADRKSTRKWKTSTATMNLVNERSAKWECANVEQKKSLNAAVKFSARNDYRNYVEDVLQDIEEAEESGDITGMYKIAKCLSNKKGGNSHTQPSVDQEGNQITTSEQQHDAWATFIEDKFAELPDEPVIDLSDPDNTEVIPDISYEEVEACVKHMKSGKAAGPDTVPIEQYKSSNAAKHELHSVLSEIWIEEKMPDDFALGDMLMFYKKKSKDDRKNYRALGLLNHAYKTFAMILLTRMLPYITNKLSDMQAGFRKGRGCRDNITILVMTVNYLLESAGNDIASQGIITYIDFTAAFDSISHSYLLNALKEYGVPLKYCRIVKAIYNSAAVRVRQQEPGGSRSYSRNISIKRGVIQGDIPSPVCFLVALDKLLKDHGALGSGLIIREGLMLSELAYADDAALPSKDASTASHRLTNLDVNAKSEAGMVISIPKTKVQHIR